MAEELHKKWFTGTDEKAALRARIGEWRCGRWTPAEIKTLKRNVRKYLKRKGVSSVQEVVFNTACGQREEFFRRAAKGIHRPLFSVYRKICRVYDIKNRIGHWTSRLTAKLIRSHHRHGNNWAVIGRKIGVSAGAARDKYRCVAARLRTGKWIPAEIERLKYAVKKVSEQQSSKSSPNPTPVEPDSPPHSPTPVESVVARNSSDSESSVVLEDNICESMWEDVAKMVVTRNSVQCRQKWLFHLDWQERGGVAMWTPQDDRILLEALLTRVSRGADDEDDIDWEELASEWESARWSPYYLRTKWTSQRRQVPRYNFKSFQDNLSYLEEELLPVLQQAIGGDPTHEHS